MRCSMDCKLDRVAGEWWIGEGRKGRQGKLGDGGLSKFPEVFEEAGHLDVCVGSAHDGGEGEESVEWRVVKTWL